MHRVDTRSPEIPGADLIAAGLEDLARGVDSAAAFVVLVGAPRLRALGVPVPPSSVPDPEHRLYALLASSDSDGAHSRYNALIRRLVSYERAVACGG